MLGPSWLRTGKIHQRLRAGLTVHLSQHERSVQLPGAVRHGQTILRDEDALKVPVEPATAAVIAVKLLLQTRSRRKPPTTFGTTLCASYHGRKCHTKADRVAALPESAQSHHRSQTPVAVLTLRMCPEIGRTSGTRHTPHTFQTRPDGVEEAWACRPGAHDSRGHYPQDSLELTVEMTQDGGSGGACASVLSSHLGTAASTGGGALRARCWAVLPSGSTGIVVAIFERFLNPEPTETMDQINGSSGGSSIMQQADCDAPGA